MTFLLKKSGSVILSIIGLKTENFKNYRIRDIINDGILPVQLNISLMRYFVGESEYVLGKRNIINSSLTVRRYSVSFSDDITCGNS